MSILSFVKGLFHEPQPPPKWHTDSISDCYPTQWDHLPHAIGLAPVQYLKIAPLVLTEQPAQTTTSQEVIIKETNMNFIAFSSNLAAIIQAVEAMAVAYSAQSGQAVPGADKMKSVVALVESAGASVAAFLPSLNGLITTLVQSYNDSGIFKKKVA